MDMMSYSKKYSRLLLWGIFSFLVLTGNLLSVIGYSSLINISPVFKSVSYTHLRAHET